RLLPHSWENLRRLRITQTEHRRPPSAQGRVSRLERLPSRLQEVGSEALAGFEMAAFGPLIPRIDENKPLVFRCRRPAEGGGLQPATIAVGVEVLINVSVDALARTVIPTRHNAWMDSFAAAA